MAVRFSISGVARQKKLGHTGNNRLPQIRVMQKFLYVAFSISLAFISAISAAVGVEIPRITL